MLAACACIFTKKMIIQSFPHQFWKHFRAASLRQHLNFLRASILLWLDGRLSAFACYKSTWASIARKQSVVVETTLRRFGCRKNPSGSSSFLFRDIDICGQPSCNSSPRTVWALFFRLPRLIFIIARFLRHCRSSYNHFGQYPVSRNHESKHVLNPQFIPSLHIMGLWLANVGHCFSIGNMPICKKLSFYTRKKSFYFTVLLSTRYWTIRGLWDNSQITRYTLLWRVWPIFQHIWYTKESEHCTQVYSTYLWHSIYCLLGSRSTAVCVLNLN